LLVGLAGSFERGRGGHPRPARKYTSEVYALKRMVVAAAMLWLGAAAPGAQPPPSGVWQDASGYLRLFAPFGTRAAAYRIFVTTLPIDRLLSRLAQDPSLLHPPGAWVPAPALPADVFGQTGSYDRSRLARLYGARRPVVARGPRGAAGRPAEAWTLVSPYPSRDLTRLESGTMLVVVDLQ
jgi:hypothetical protein